jgi:hypothetical protein
MGSDVWNCGIPQIVLEKRGMKKRIVKSMLTSTGRGRF